MLDLEEIKTKWLNQCGACDAGLPEYGCTHPDEDYRPVMLRLVEEIERLRGGMRVQYGIGEKGRIGAASSRVEAAELAPFSADKKVYVRVVGPWQEEATDAHS